MKDGETNYFETYAELDEEHEKMRHDHLKWSFVRKISALT